MCEQEALLDQIMEQLKSPKDIIKALSSLIESNSALQKSIQQYQLKEISSLKNDLLADISSQNGINYLIHHVEVPTAEALKNLAFDIQSSSEDIFCLLTAEIEGKASLALAISKSLVDGKGFNAGQIIRDLAKEVQGGGGGQAFLATAGGQNPNGIPTVLELAKKYL